MTACRKLVQAIAARLRKCFLRCLLRLLGAHHLYAQVVQTERDHDIARAIRADMERLLRKVNENNPYFRGRFTAFLRKIEGKTDQQFFAEYGKLPAFTKRDYAEAGRRVMPERYGPQTDHRELAFCGNPLQVIAHLRRRDFILPMATGGSTTWPLTVYMNKHHAFSMLFTFFKCWRRMGWELGQKILVFYPSGTYNIDDMARLNRFSALSGFRILLFDKIDVPTVRQLVEQLNRYRPKMLLVFPSPLNMVAHAIRKHHLRLRHQPELINVSGETFFDCQRQNIQSVFTRSRIEDSYGSVELGEIAHETRGGLEAFANVAYVENRTNDAGMPELIITRLQLDSFPFIRYQMRDIARVRFRRQDGKEQFLIQDIEGKDGNFILSHGRERLYPSFFNRFVNRLNEQFDHEIVEVKVYERGRQHLEVQLITRSEQAHDCIRQAARQYLEQKIGRDMQYEIRFVDFIDHDYRRKYRVIQRQGDIEYAGGIVGDEAKLARIQSVSASLTPFAKGS